MSTQTRLIKASIKDVWAVLNDGWLYPLWVVGASRMRTVDASWPIVGSKLHHSVGSWPLMLNDTTEVLEITAGRSLLLRARARPAGTAQVQINLQTVTGGTLVELTEDVISGPARLIPRPIRSYGIRLRNTESLKRLAYLAENRQHPR